MRDIDELIGGGLLVITYVDSLDAMSKCYAELHINVRVMSKAALPLFMVSTTLSSVAF